MLVPIPADFRQGVRLIGNLDIPSTVIVGLGCLTATHVITGPAPLALKGPEAALALVAGVTFGLGRWPLDHGDRLLRWAARAGAYWMRPRQASPWRATARRARGGRP